MKNPGLHLAYLVLAGSMLSSMLFSCGSNSKNEGVPTDILNIDVNNTKPLSDIFKDRHYIPIAESDTFPGLINAGALVNDTIYILDPNKAPGVYVYTINGKYIRKFPNIGSGPGEMGMITDMVVDKAHVHLYDFMRFSVETYSHDGKWIKSTPIPPGTASFMTDDKGIWCDFANQAYNSNNKLIHQSFDNDSISVIHKIPEHLTNVTLVSGVNFQRSNDNILYMPNFEPQIFYVTDSTKSLAYTLDFNGLWPDNSFFEHLRDMDSNERNHFLLEKDLPINKLVFHANDNWLIVSFNNNGSKYACVMNLKTGEQHTYDDENKDFGSILFLKDNKVYTVEGDDQLGVYTIEM